jgi:type IV pilus assembly protein PilF
MRIALAFAALLLAACSSQSTTETKQVTDNTPANGRRRAEVHTALAGEYYARGNYPVALSEVRAAINDDSSYYGAYNMQGLVLMQLREHNAARDSFNQALKLQPNNPEVLNNYGWFLCVSTNEGQRGLDLIKRAQLDTMYPTPEKAYVSAGLCLRRLGRNQEAEDQLRRAVLIRPDLIGALFNLAQITFERGDMKEAETYLLRYMKLNSQPNLEALVMGVKIARARNDGAAEQSYLQQLRRRFPDSPEFAELTEKRQ